MENNLTNITVNDPIYKVITDRVMEYLPENLKKLYSNVQQLPVIAGDNYFLHYSLYPQLRSKNSDNILDKVLGYYKQYVNSNEYQKIKQITTLDDELSLLHTIKLTENIAEILKQELEKQIQNMPQQQIQQLMQMLGMGGVGSGGNSQQGGNQDQQSGSTAVDPDRLLDKLLQQAQNNQQAQQVLNQLMNNAMNKVASNPSGFAKAFVEAKEKTEKAKELKDLMGGRSAGKEPGSFRKLLDLADKVYEVKDADKIISLGKKIESSLPRFTKIRKERSRLGDEVGGYARTHKIEKAIPRELALPDELFYMKLVNGFISKEKIVTKEGSYYVIIDKSGSMEGEKTVWARSVALSLYKLARKKKRRYFLRFFDTRVYPSDKPLSNPYDIVEHILAIKSDGGTDITYALRTALKDLKEHGLDKYTNTVIIITDGEDEVDERLVEEFKRANTVLVAVMISGYNSTLEKIAKATGGQYTSAELTSDGALKIISLVR